LGSAQSSLTVETRNFGCFSASLFLVDFLVFIQSFFISQKVKFASPYEVPPSSKDCEFSPALDAKASSLQGMILF
jgi:hypothetical protein